MQIPASTDHRPLYLSVGLITAALLALALSFDYPSALDGGFFSDCATYYALAHSLAHDFDLEYTRTDLQRMYAEFSGGPSGIFLQENQESRRLYYGKSYTYPLFLAPFVRVLGTRGVLAGHAVLFGLALLAMTLLLERQLGWRAALLTGLAFTLPSAALVFYLWIAPEFFNFAIILLAYFFLLYKEFNPAGESDDRLRRILTGPWTDLACFTLLGIATYSKLSNGVLALPAGLFLLARGRWKSIFLGGALFVVMGGLLFGVQLSTTGHWNYQGGVRKSFAGEFPFANGKDFTTAGGTGMETNLGEWQPPFDPVDIAHNSFYFFFGRYGGIVPYYFPAFLALILFLVYDRRNLARWLMLLGILCGAATYIILVPTNVIGGGGTVANRYFMNILPLFFFLLPGARPRWFPAAAAIGGLLFMGHVLINPLFHSRYPAHYAQTPLLRLLPVELTMLNDLPARTDPDRSRVEWYRVENGAVLRDAHGPVVDFYTYQLDHNSYIKEPNPRAFYPLPDGTLTRDLVTERGTQQIWTVGGRTAEIILRTGSTREKMIVRVTNAAIANTVTISLQGEVVTLEMKPRESRTVTFHPGSSFAYHYLSTSHLYSLSVNTRTGVTPRTMPDGGNDWRFLGAMLEIRSE